GCINCPTPNVLSPTTIVSGSEASITVSNSQSDPHPALTSAIIRSSPGLGSKRRCKYVHRCGLVSTARGQPGGYDWAMRSISPCKNLFWLSRTVGVLRTEEFHLNGAIKARRRELDSKVFKWHHSPFVDPGFECFEAVT